MAKKYSFGKEDLAKVKLEALVMEKMTAAPSILDIYSHCGTSVIIEAMSSEVSKHIVPGKGVVEQSNLYAEGQFRSYNNLTASERLEIAISMAESLANLHNFKGGAIVHADVNIEQWLLDDHGRLKLNDFNLAEILPWNDQTQHYCPFSRKYDGAFRLVRSPEEFMGVPMGTKKDVYSFGNIIYSLLTGMWPFYGELARINGAKERRDAINNGNRPYIDEGLNQTPIYIERQLLDVMKQCWHSDHMKRPSISQVATSLNDIKETARQKGELNTHSSLLVI